MVRQWLLLTLPLILVLALISGTTTAHLTAASTAWQLAPSMRVGRSGLAAVAVNGSLYVLGGSNNGTDQAGAPVERMKINPDGSLGSFQMTSSLTTPRARFAAVAGEGYIFAIGGVTGFQAQALNSIERAAVNSDGSLGPWQLVSHLPEARQDHAAVIVGSYLYVLGGYPNARVTQRVDRAELHEDGTLGPWQTLSSMREPRASFGVAVAGDKLYALGGTGSSLTTVEYTTIASDGSLGPWQPASTMNMRRDGAVAVAAGGHLYALGGAAEGTMPWHSSTSVERAPINADGSLGPWHKTEAMSHPRTFLAAAVVEEMIYAIGGLSTDSANLNSVERVAFEDLSDIIPPVTPTPGPREPGEWQLTTPMLVQRAAHALVMANGYLYAIGGSINGNAEAVTTVERAEINPDGSLGSWQQMTALTTPRVYLAAAAVGGYIYAIGGSNGFQAPDLSSIERAAINSDGSLGAWEVISHLPTARLGHTAVAAHGYLYVLGGHPDAPPTASVERAPINVDGTLGAWETISTMRQARGNFAVAVAGNYLYALGGDSGDLNTLNTVEYTTINVDGSLAPWQLASNMQEIRVGLGAVAADTYLYALGGARNSSVFKADNKTVERAQINADGSLGPWEQVQAMVEPRIFHAAVIAGNMMYMTGGMSPTPPNHASVEAALFTKQSIQRVPPSLAHGQKIYVPMIVSHRSG